MLKPSGAFFERLRRSRFRLLVAKDVAKLCLASGASLQRFLITISESPAIELDTPPKYTLRVA